MEQKAFDDGSGSAANPGFRADLNKALAVSPKAQRLQPEGKAGTARLQVETVSNSTCTAAQLLSVQRMLTEEHSGSTFSRD